MHIWNAQNQVNALDDTHNPVPFPEGQSLQRL
jgi:hypothetical protein